MGAFFKHKEKDSASGDDCVKLCNVQAYRELPKANTRIMGQ